MTSRLTKQRNGGSVENKEYSEAQVDFLNICKDLGWGKLEVLVQNGEPAHSRLIEKTYQHKKSSH